MLQCCLQDWGGLGTVLCVSVSRNRYTEVSLLTGVSRNWRTVVLKSLKTVTQLDLSGFTESLWDEDVWLSLVHVTSGNLRRSTWEGVTTSTLVTWRISYSTFLTQDYVMTYGHVPRWHTTEGVVNLQTADRSLNRRRESSHVTGLSLWKGAILEKKNMGSVRHTVSVGVRDLLSDLSDSSKITSKTVGGEDENEFS